MGTNGDKWGQMGTNGDAPVFFSKDVTGPALGFLPLPRQFPQGAKTVHQNTRSSRGPRNNGTARPKFPRGGENVKCKKVQKRGMGGHKEKDGTNVGGRLCNKRHE
jgi:hypothetical protein